ncbi:MAG: tRNA lysidine(34) synthetase TilS [Coprobacillaceae bacterium]
MKINMSLLEKNKKYIVGVSGGVDSMALLDILQKQQYHLIVCHVNYHLRHDSNEDQTLVETYCKTHNIPCFIKEVSNKEYQKDNFQMQAREIRYGFYREIGERCKTNSVILGHHLDDVIETIYMQLERKNTKGYLGISATSKVMEMDVYRPFIEAPKAQLYEYCKKYEVPYHEDYTNFQTDFTRDYVRNVTLKEISDIDKQKLLLKAKEHNIRYKNKHNQLVPYIKLYQRQKYLRYSKIPRDMLEDIIYQMIKETVYPPYISNTLVEEVVKQLQSKKPNIEVTLPLNTVFIKEYDNIYVSKTKSIDGYCLKYSNLVYDKHDYFYLSKEGHINEGIYVESTDFPLVIRSYRPGDMIVTSGGTKKVSRLFIDKKVPKRQRHLWPVVERADGTIILVPNIAKNIGYLYTKPNIFVIKYKDLGE